MRYLLKLFYYKWHFKQCKHICVWCKYKRYCHPTLKEDINALLMKE